MAQLRDTVVSGSLRTTDTLYSTTAQFNILRAPTTSGGTTFSPGTENNLLKSNGSSIYWTTLAASDIPNLSTDKLNSGTLGTNHGGTGVNSHTANRLVWSKSATELQATSHYVNSTKIGVNYTSNEPSSNFYVNGTSIFNIGTDDSSSKKNLYILGNNRLLSLGAQGLQAYTRSGTTDTAGLLYIQYAGGNIEVGSTSTATATRTLYGVFEFKSANGFNYSGIAAGSDNVARTVWFSCNGRNGQPVYDNDFRYNPSTNVLTIGKLTITGGIANSSLDTSGTMTISSGSSKTLSLISNSTLYLNSAANTSIIFTRGGADTDHELARFDMDGFVPKSNSSYTIGTSSLKWPNIYATTFTGDLTGNVTGNVSGTAANVTGTVAVDHGGTGATTAAVARTNLLAATGNARIFYGTCDTAAATVDKVVTCTTYDALTVGDLLVIKFTNTNSGAVGSLTLNVNGKGAKAVKKLYNGAINNLTGVGELNKDTLCLFMYNGTQWVLINGDWNSTYSYMMPYCSTAAGTAAKTSSIWKFQLTAGKYFPIAIYYDNTVQGAITLNINSTGAKPIYINGTASSASNYTLPAGIYIVYYNGTNYYFRTDNGIQGGTWFGTASTASAVAWTGITGKPIELGAYSGALNSNGWKTLGGRSSGAKIYVAYNNNSANWNSATYSSSIVFGASDVKGLLDVGHNKPIVTFGGASTGNSDDNNPKWYFKLSGTSGQTYTFPSSSKTLAATDGTGASGSWNINLALRYNSLTKGTNPTSRVCQGCWFGYDKNGIATANRIGGGLESFIEPDGSTRTELRSYRYASGAISYTSLAVVTAQNGDSFVGIIPNSGRAYLNLAPLTDTHSDIKFSRNNTDTWALSARSSSDGFFGLYNHLTSNWPIKVSETSNQVSLLGSLIVGTGNQSLDLKASNNGTSSSIWLPDIHWIDKNGLDPGLISAGGYSTGNSFLYLGVRNYNSNGERTANSGISILGGKDGSVSYLFNGTGQTTFGGEIIVNAQSTTEGGQIRLAAAPSYQSGQYSAILDVETSSFRVVSNNAARLWLNLTNGDLRVTGRLLPDNAVEVARGGTGASTAPAARYNLGIYGTVKTGLAVSANGVTSFAVTDASVQTTSIILITTDTEKTYASVVIETGKYTIKVTNNNTTNKTIKAYVLIIY